jgi:hypothetical protein
MPGDIDSAAYPDVFVFQYILEEPFQRGYATGPSD